MQDHPAFLLAVLRCFYLKFYGCQQIYNCSCKAGKSGFTRTAFVSGDYLSIFIIGCYRLSAVLVIFRHDFGIRHGALLRNYCVVDCFLHQNIVRVIFHSLMIALRVIGNKPNHIAILVIIVGISTAIIQVTDTLGDDAFTIDGGVGAFLHQNTIGSGCGTNQLTTAVIFYWQMVSVITLPF